MYLTISIVHNSRIFFENKLYDKSNTLEVKKERGRDIASPKSVEVWHYYSQRKIRSEKDVLTLIGMRQAGFTPLIIFGLDFVS